MTRTVMLAAIAPGLSISGIPGPLSIGSAYSCTLTGIGGTPAYRFAESGSLPAGITFTDNGNGTATIAGTPTASGSFPIIITLADFARNLITQNYTLTAVALPLTISGHLPNQTQGVAITPYTYTTSGGYGGNSFAITSGALPSGLSLNTSTGQITGTPSTASTYSWTVTVTDSHSVTKNLSDGCAVGYATLTVSGSFTATASAASAYSSDLPISGGNPPYALGGTSGVASGSLPAGLSLSIVNVSGSYYLRLSGTPTTAASSTFIAAITSSDGQSANTSSQTIVVSSVHWDSAAKGTNIVISNGNADINHSSGACCALAGSIVSKTSLAHYYEVMVVGTPTFSHDYLGFVGIGDTSTNLNNWPGVDTHSCDIYNLGVYFNGGYTGGSGAGAVNGDTIGIAAKWNSATSKVDIWFHKNGTWIGNSPTGAANSSVAIAGTSIRLCGGFDSGENTTVKLRLPSSLTYSIPSGFTRWPG